MPVLFFNPNLVSDWANFTVYFFFLLAGYLMGAVPELLHAVEKCRLVALVLGVTAFLARIAIYTLFIVSGGYNAANIIAQAFRGIAAYVLVMAAMGYGQRYLNRQGRMLGIARPLLPSLYPPLRSTHCSDVSAFEYRPLHLDQMDSCGGRFMEFCCIVYFPGAIHPAGQGLLWHRAAVGTR
jgi:hypothetical protein